MNKLLTSAKIEKAGYVILFLFILICNLLTLRFVDDYQYVFSFATNERIESVADIFPSLIAHTKTMNGRLVAHFFVHLFCLLPMWVFDVINSLFFMLMIFCITKISRGENARNNAIHFAIFCAIWLFEPVFGQVNFWIAGSCNYLWSSVFGFAFLFPFINEYMYGSTMKTGKKAVFLVFSFAAGAYSESGSAAFIAMAALLMLLHLLNKKQLKLYLLLALIVALLGYVSIYLAPAQWNNKAAEFSFATLYANIVRSIKMYETFGILAVSFAVMLVFARMNGVDQKRIMLAIVLVVGSLCANFILVFANWYHERSAMSACVLLVAADAVLLQELYANVKCKAGAISIIVVMTLMMPSALMTGFSDIYYTCLSMKNREAYIYQCIEEGQEELEVPIVEASTKYTPLYGLRYLSVEQTDTWPNGSMAYYYGVNSILGIEKKDG